MRRSVFLVTWVPLIGLGLVVPVHGGEAQGRRVLVEIRIKDAEGNLIPNVWLQVGEAKSGRGETNQEGIFALEVEVKPAEERISTRLALPENSRQNQAKLRLIKKYFIERSYDLELRNGVHRYTKEVVFWPVISVSGTVASNKVKEAKAIAVALHAGLSWPVVLGPGGQFRLDSLRKGEPCQILVGHGGYYLPIQLTAEQTKQNVDLGRIVVDLPQNTGTLRAVVNEWRDSKGVRLVTFIEANGRCVIQQVAQKDGTIGKVEPRREVTLPSGKYYFVPHSIVEKEAGQVWDWIQQKVHLGRYGYHPLEIQAGQTLESVFCAEDTLQRIRDIAKMRDPALEQPTQELLRLKIGDLDDDGKTLKARLGPLLKLLGPKLLPIYLEVVLADHLDNQDNEAVLIRAVAAAQAALQSGETRKD